MSIFSYKNPADAAKPYIDQVPGTIKPYYQPYIDSGQDALSSLTGEYNTLMKDPGSVLSRIGGGYTESPGYQFQVQQATNGANNAAAAGGMLGTPASQEQLARLTQSLASQDYDNYMKDAEGLYGKGLSGEEGINKMGYGASNELAQSLANILMSQGSLASASAAGKNANSASELGSIASLASTILGAFL